MNDSVRNFVENVLLLLVLCAVLFLCVGCAEININVWEGATATITIEQDRTITTTDATVPVGELLK